jgi:myo-inositol catabolism protein IolC
MQNLGYTQNLFILPFDHRSTFEKAQFKDIPGLKQIIYEAFKKSLDTVQNGAIMVDEEYGDNILRDAKENGYTVIVTTEKSGSEDFVFEYGEEFEDHIKKYGAKFAKALVRTQNGISELSITNLKKLSDFCHGNGIKFILEVLAEGQLELIINSITELQNAQVEPDIWKVEGMQNESSYEKIVAASREGGRENVSVVILGRGENRSLVDKWIKTGSKVPGVIGFAIGRTIFWDAISQFNDGKITKEEAVLEISENYKYFYNLFLDKKAK